MFVYYLDLSVSLSLYPLVYCVCLSRIYMTYYYHHPQRKQAKKGPLMPISAVSSRNGIKRKDKDKDKSKYLDIKEVYRATKRK